MSLYQHTNPKKSYKINVNYIVDDRVGYELLDKDGKTLRDNDGNVIGKWKQFSKKYFEANYKAFS